MGPRQHRRLILLIYADYHLAVAALAKKRIRRELAHSRLGDPGAASNPGRITPSGVLAHRASAPHAAPRPSGANGLPIGWRDVAHHGPEETDQLARHRDDRNLRPLPIRQMIVPLMQPLLRFPRVRDDGGRLALLPPLEIDADLRAMPVTPRRLHQDVATVPVAGLRDRAEALSVAARIFA